MRASLEQAAIVLVATFVVAAPASAQGWYERYGPVYDGPYYDGPYYTGPYNGAFAQLAYPDESHYLMERRARQPSWGWWGGSDWAGARSGARAVTRSASADSAGSDPRRARTADAPEFWNEPAPGRTGQAGEKYREEGMIRTPVCDLLDIEHPIALGGMGSATRRRLVAAVSKAGGLGALGCHYLTPEQIAQRDGRDPRARPTSRSA